MDEIGDLLSYRTPQEPPEIAAIKRYVDEHFQIPVQVGIQNEAIVITVASASLANTLRLRLPQLQLAAKTTRKLIFRIN
jgi:hypothetical protein